MSFIRFSGTFPFLPYASISDDAGRTRLIRCWPQLISFIVVIRIYDLVIQCVSDLNSKRESLQNVFASDRYVLLPFISDFLNHGRIPFKGLQS